MTKRAKIYGKVDNELEAHEALSPELAMIYRVKECIKVSKTRSNTGAVVVDLNETDILSVRFTDDTEWIGFPENIEEIYDENPLERRSASSEDFVFDPQITSGDATRGGIKRALMKVFTVFELKDKAAEFTMKSLGSKFDKKVQPDPGVYKIDINFERTPYVASLSNQPFLLFIHGTLSSTVEAFSGLKESQVWSSLVSHYQSQILGLDHYTLTKGPLENALDFLKACPEGAHIDIISHSRGGLVADILAKCDHNNGEHGVIGFSQEEMAIIAHGEITVEDENDDTSLEFQKSLDLMVEINKEALEKKITIGKVVRVASPSSGTTLLSRRLDFFFNVMLNAVSLAFGIKNPLYHTVKSFLMELLQQRGNPEILPGLLSMMPESAFQKMLNSAETEVASTLYTIAGDSNVGGLNISSLKVIFANIYFVEGNDLVVDTDHMTHGIARKDGFFELKRSASDIHHFNYFINKHTSGALLEALVATEENPARSFTKKVLTAGDRGVVLNLLSLSGTNFNPKKITKDVVIFIPGIMGSTLAVGGEDQWVQMSEMNKGAISRKLNYSATNVEVSGVVDKFYGDFGRYFSSRYDVISLAFDWRKSVKEAAKALAQVMTRALEANKGKVHIIAHSMGGLVARRCMMDHTRTWDRFRESDANKLVMLGTPWRGSYLIMEVLTGHSRRVKQIAALDFRNSKADLLKIFWKFPGIFELLPLKRNSKRVFWDLDFWKGIIDAANLGNVIPDVKTNQRSLREFKEFHEETLAFTEKIENDAAFFKNIYYICGQDKKTVSNYKFKKKFLSKAKKLVYLATSKGDGSVTWQTGIPKPLVNSDRLYYTRTTHADLANDPAMYEGIIEILEKGNTRKLLQQEPSTRGGELITEVHQHAVPLAHKTSVVDAIFGRQFVPESREQDEIHVRVINGDLKTSKYPVMVGHFFMDLILSAEKAVDKLLNNRLSQRMDIGYYPGKIGESEVFFNLETQPKGAIVCGLGYTDTLTSHLLSRTIKFAVLKYAMFMRDNYTLPKAKEYATGISFMLIGIGYGKLPIEDSLKGILLGVAEANAQIKRTRENLQPIEEIEIVNYYESIASQAYFISSRLQRSDNRLPLQLDKGVIRRAGAKKKQLVGESRYNRWYNLQITSETIIDQKTKEEKVIGYNYYSSQGLARVEQEMIGIGIHKIYHLLHIQSKSPGWDPKLSKTLFEMLVPNDFKNVFRNQGNMILKLDKKAAEIPWELLYDSKMAKTPVAVSSSFIRQLVTEDSSQFHPVSTGNKCALVIGDPLYESDSLKALPAAKAEAEWVAARLKVQGYQPIEVINQDASTILMEFYNHRYKIMHFAGHGLYAPKDGEVGIAIGKGITIDPAMIKQLGYVPEFVFVNCCYSGAMSVKDDDYTRDRYRLAANVGTQLIEMGVKAIIISGWAVDDAAAKTFSETFYESLFDGYDFGIAVQKARFKCYQDHPGINTWGAYQCYGNQFYKLGDTRRRQHNELEYVIAQQVYTDMDNLLVAIRDRKNTTEQTRVKLDQYIVKAEQANLLDGVVLEKEALIYDELDMPEIANDKFVELFKYANGNFSIEALEQFCVIKSYQMKVETIKEDLQTIELLTNVGKNSSRLNIVANAYKFAASKVNGVRSLTYIETALDKYINSFEIAQNRYEADYLDALTNIIFLGHILEKKGKGTLTSRLRNSKKFTKGTDIKAELLKFYFELRDLDKSDLHINVQIGMAEARYALRVFKDKFKPSFKINMIEELRGIFSLQYSPRLIKIEQLQIELLRSYFGDDTVIYQQLTEILNEIRKLK